MMVVKKYLTTEDTVVNRVLSKFVQRSDEGMQRFGVSMADAAKPTHQWIEDAQEELMDAILYLEKLKERFDGKSI